MLDPAADLHPARERPPSHGPDHPPSCFAWTLPFAPDPGFGGESFEFIKSVFDNLGQGVLVFDQDRIIQARNDLFCRMVAFRPDFVRPGMSANDLIDEAFRLGHYGDLDLEQAHAAWNERLAVRRPARHRNRLGTGQTLSVAYVPMPTGGWLITYDDVTERLETDRALAAQRDIFDAAVSNMPHGLGMFDEQGGLILCNPAYRELYALPEALNRPGTTLAAILAYRQSVGNAPRDLDRYLDVVHEARRQGYFASRRVPLADGRTIQITHNPTRGGYVAIHEDVTAIVRAEAEVRHLASHDALTGLPNRTTLRERLGAALAGLAEAQSLAVHWLDLDDFKGVNDTLGHPVGDQLLCALTKRLSAVAGPSCTLARLSGDEFVVLQVGSAASDEPALLARRLVESMAEPFEIDRHRISVGVSIGIARGPVHGTTPDDLLKKADIALYSAKAGGRNRFSLYEPAMDEPIQARRMLELDLRAALSADALRLHYQPLVDAASGRVNGFEALLRWTHPTLGPISPATLIPLAEDTGLIEPIGRWVLQQACRDAARWPDGLRVAVNLSAIQFRAGYLPDTVMAALADADLSPSRLELEITESVLLVDSETTLASLRSLHAMGIRIALDDFGTGYSSLSYLRSFPFDKIKIDKSFVRDIDTRADCSVIMQAVASLGSALGMGTTAEGIETPEQLALARRFGCTEVQGFLYSRPLPADAIPVLLERLAEAHQAAP